MDLEEAVRLGFGEHPRRLEKSADHAFDICMDTYRAESQPFVVMWMQDKNSPDYNLWIARSINKQVQDVLKKRLRILRKIERHLRKKVKR